MTRRILVGTALCCGLLVSALHARALLQYSSAWGGWAPLSMAWGWGIPVAVVLQVIAHTLRARNSQRLLEVVRPSGLLPNLRGLSIGFLFNALMPFRLGEVVRAHVVGRSMAISRGVVFFTILFERAVDGLILSAFAIGVAAYLGDQRPALMATVGTLGAAVGMVSAATAVLIYVLYSQNRHVLRWVHESTRLFNDRIRDRLRFVLWSVIYGMHVILRSARLGRYLATSAAMWMLYLGSIAALVHGVAPGRTLLEKLSASSAAYLSVSIPSGPAFIGTFHLYFSRLARESLGLAGTPLELSGLTWAVLMVPFSLIGAGFVVLRRRAAPTAEAGVLEPLKNKLYRDSDVSAELSHFLDEYFSGQQVSRVLSRGEMKGDFRIVKTFKGGSNASTLLVWEGDKLCVKKLTLRQHAEKLKAQVEWLHAHSHLAPIPRVTRESHGEDYYAFSLEYRESFVPFFEFIHSESRDHSARVLDGVIDFMYGQVYRPGPPGPSAELLQRYVDEKVLGKVKDASALSPTLAALVEGDTLIVNGVPYLNLTACVERLRALPGALADLESFSQGPIHGDLTVDNLIVSRATGEFLVLDPNNENAISDPVVDMAKLFQSLHSGYEFLCQLPAAEVRGREVRFEESTSSRYAALFAHLREQLGRRLPPHAMRAILFHEAVHYCRMLTYRARINEASLPAFYATAVKRFNDFLQQYESPSAGRNPSAPDEEVRHVPGAAA